MLRQAFYEQYLVFNLNFRITKKLYSSVFVGDTYQQSRLFSPNDVVPYY